MKYLLIILLCLFGSAQAQTIGYLRYDSVKMAKNGGTTELILENATKAVTGGVLTNTGNGRTAFVTPSAATVPLSGITAATATNTANHANYAQEHQWNTLAGISGFKFSSNSTAAASNSQRLVEMGLSGNNATASQTTTTLYVTNTHGGTTPINKAIYAEVSGGSASSIAIQAQGNTGTGIQGLAGGGGYGIKSSASSTGVGIQSLSNTGYAGNFIASGAGVTVTSLRAEASGASTTNNALYVTASGAGTNNAIEVAAGDVLLTPLTASQFVSLDANKKMTSSAVASSILAASLTDEVGTDKVVFNTSPSFVTSVIGGASMDIFNTVTTTANFLKAATTVNMMASAGVLNFGGGATAAELRFLEPSGSGSNYTGFKAAAMAGNTIYTLPNAFPAGTYLMQSTSAGVLSFLDPATLSGLPYIALTGTSTLTGDIVVNGGGSFNFTIETGDVGIYSDKDNSTLLLGNNGGASVMIDHPNLKTIVHRDVQFDSYGAGALTTDGSGNITAVSDRRAKRNIKPFRMGLNEVMNLHPSTFIYNQDKSNLVMPGFIAQDVQKAFGGIGVGKMKDSDMLTLNTNVIMVALVNSVKELKAQNDELKRRINKLENK